MRHAILGALALFTTLLPQNAQAAWPREVEIEVCWDMICNGTTTTWLLRKNGTFEDSYASTGTFFFKKFYPGWPYADDLLLFYDNGQTSYTGNIDPVTKKLNGSMITYVFYPPYVIEGMFCQDGC